LIGVGSRIRLGGHVQGAGDEQRVLLGVDRPADDLAGERVENDAAVDLALPGRVLSDVGHLETVRCCGRELAPEEVGSSELADLRALRRALLWKPVEAETTHQQCHGLAV